MQDAANYDFTPEETARMRAYLLKGGFLSTDVAPQCTSPSTPRPASSVICGWAAWRTNGPNRC